MTPQEAHSIKIGDEVIIDDDSQLVGRVTAISLGGTTPTISVNDLPYPITDVSSTRIRRQRSKRVVVVGDTTVCSEQFGVTRLTTKHGAKHTHRRVPCEQCPFRMDVPTGVFPTEAFRVSAHTAYDGAFETFACHMSGFAGLTCAGFLHRHDIHNVGVRLSRGLGRLSDAEIGDGGFPIYPTYREMAIANGVAPDDPCLDDIRGNNEDAPFFRNLVKKGRKRK